MREYFGALLQPNLWWLQIIAAILSGLFLWGIVYIINNTNYFEVKKEQFLDVLGKGYVSKRRTLRGWKQIQKRMASEESNQWKLAILEADHILNEILKMSGYLGSRLDEKLELITSAQLANVDEVKNANLVRNKIAKDPTYELSRGEAEEVIEIYKQALKELNLIQE
jgi:hypothetical protein